MDETLCLDCGAHLAQNGLCTPCLLHVGLDEGHLRIRCPHCNNPVEVIDDNSLKDISCGNCGGSFSLVSDEALLDSDLTPGTVGHFELEERLGSGAFGTVWKARDTLLDRTVAIKIPRKEHATEFDAEKFFREARAAAQLNHPNIVSVHED